MNKITHIYIIFVIVHFCLSFYDLYGRRTCSSSLLVIGESSIPIEYIYSILFKEEEEDLQKSCLTELLHFVILFCFSGIVLLTGLIEYEIYNINYEENKFLFNFIIPGMLFISCVEMSKYLKIRYEIIQEKKSGIKEPLISPIDV